jgi:hypothetical protein
MERVEVDGVVYEEALRFVRKWFNFMNLYTRSMSLGDPRLMG